MRSANACPCPPQRDHPRVPLTLPPPGERTVSPPTFARLPARRWAYQAAPHAPSTHRDAPPLSRTPDGPAPTKPSLPARLVAPPNAAGRRYPGSSLAARPPVPDLPAARSPPKPSLATRPPAAIVFGPHNAGVAQLVERQLPKLNVVGSSPIARSTISRVGRELRRPRFARARSCRRCAHNVPGSRGGLGAVRAARREHSGVS